MTNLNIAAKFAAVLSLGVTVIHWMDQGGSHMKDPLYIGVGYYLIELAGVAAALMLLARANRRGLALALGVATAPFLGYVLSRTVGLPAAMDDIGNWTEPLGLISLVVEGSLLALASLVLMRAPGRRWSLTSRQAAHEAPESASWAAS